MIDDKKIIETETLEISIITEIKEKRRIIEECDSAFLEPITKRPDFEQLLEKIQKYADFLWLHDNVNTVGYAAIYANDQDTRSAYITLFGICSAYQRRGLGTRLMYACFDLARLRSMKTIRLEVLQRNVKARKFYTAMGFCESGETTFDGLYFQRFLPNE